MNKLILSINFFLLSTAAVFGQYGLENVIVEKYYVSDANDSIGTDAISASPGALPVGSVTYRIFVDMLPGYKLQAIYGVPLGALSNEHEFKISTTTLFFNNEDRGATTPNAINNNYVDKNSVMLDSWLSMGGASSTKLGILKSKDDGIATVVNSDNMLLNNDTSAGIPLTVQDGLIAGTPPQVADIGISNEILVFDNQNDGTNGPVFSTTNGSLYCLLGAVGPDTIDNQVLVAQITTNGVLCFDFNIQLGTPGGGVEKYVTSNPFDSSEIVLPFLSWCSNNPPNAVHEVKLPESEFSLYPNPVMDNLTMEIELTQQSNTISYSIFDVLGNLRYSKDLGKISGSYNEKIDLSSLANGLYFVELNMDGKISTRKFVKE